MSPILILFNKTDRAASADALNEWRALEKTLLEQQAKSQHPDRPLRLYPTSLLRRDGVTEAFDWLADQL